MTEVKKGAELVLLPEPVRGLPQPREFGAMLKQWLESEIQRVRAERGPTSAPEDSFALVRSLQTFWELMSEYARVINGVVKVAKQEQEEELKIAVGDNDGVPNSSLNVPDTDGTVIKLTRTQANVHTIDVDPLYAALAWQIVSTTGMQEEILEAALAAAMDLDDRPKTTAALNDTIMRGLITGMEKLATLGKFEPQVSKVRALAKSLAGLGMDDVAATVTGAIRTKQDYKGVTPTREVPK